MRLGDYYKAASCFQVATVLLEQDVQGKRSLYGLDEANGSSGPVPADNLDPLVKLVERRVPKKLR